MCVCDCVPQKVHGEVLLVIWQMPVTGLVSGSQPVRSQERARCHCCQLSKCSFSALRRVLVLWLGPWPGSSMSGPCPVRSLSRSFTFSFQDMFDPHGWSEDSYYEALGNLLAFCCLLFHTPIRLSILPVT